MKDKKIDDEIRGLKYNTNKIRWELLPKDALEQIACVFTHGAVKYEAENWRKGIPFSECIGSMYRHLSAFERGEDIDPNSTLFHLAHLNFWSLILLHFILNIRDQKDKGEYPNGIMYNKFDDRIKDCLKKGFFPVSCLDESLWEKEKCSIDLHLPKSKSS
jgi:hypothetical protein